jgi:hypothetical protein
MVKIFKKVSMRRAADIYSKKPKDRTLKDLIDLKKFGGDK